MKKLNPLFIFLILSLALLPNVYSQNNEIEKKFINAGLIDVNTIDSSIQVDLVNSDPNKNYFRENFYNGLNKAYLQKEVAIKLSKAQKKLKARKKGFSLLRVS